MAAGRLCVKSGKKGTAGGHSEYIDDVDAPAPSPFARSPKPKRDDIVARGSGNMPRWAITPRVFWQAADNYERANGAAYREQELTIPRELSLPQRLNLLAAWIKQELGDAHAFQWAMHEPDALDGGTNPHVHLMFSERQVDGIERDPDTYFKRYNAKQPERGGCKKGWGAHAGETRSIDERRADLVELRGRWERLVNEHLAAAGVDARIDMRSYVDRGVVDVLPERKLSPIEGRTPEVIADLVAFRAARSEYQAAQAEADAVVVELSSRRPQAVAVVPEPEPEHVQALAVPAPVKSDRSARELERLLAHGEQKLAELEARKLARERAEAAYRSTRVPAEAAAVAYKAAQGGLFARALSWFGVGPIERARRELEPLASAFQAALKARDQAIAELQGAERDSVGLPERIQDLRTELASVREYDARDARAVDQVVALVARLDRALDVGDPRRDDWRTLQAVDRGRLIQWDHLRDPYEPLRQLLAAQPDTRLAMTAEISARLAELEAIERDTRPGLGLSYDRAPGM